MIENQNTPEPSIATATENSETGRVADATDNNWVDRNAPEWARPYLRLSRADRPAGTWLLLLPCWWGYLLAKWQADTIPNWHDAWYFVAFGIGAFLMRGAGCTWNDISDREFDAQVARTKSRPIPSGQVSTRQAAVWMICQALIAFAILLTFNPFSIVLGIAALIPVAIYPFAKRFTWWPQIFLGLAFNWGALLGWAAVHGSLGAAPVSLYIAGIFWTLFYDTIYALQDKEDDALIGVKSTARLFGKSTPTWLFAFLFFTIICMGGAVVFAFSPSINLISLLIAITTLWAFGWHLAWQLRVLDIENAEICLKLFRANRDAGLIVVLGLAFAIVAKTLPALLERF
ncbi:4-hydroxybenzoate octaprenyltransferase [Paramylibacter ulvae]|nr:4-hydroxybenzoate octaprenyltransferase [Amylibacter ulvae]